MLTWEYPPRIIGGLSRHVHSLSRSLAKKNIEVHVLTCADPSAPFFEINDNVYVHRVKPFDLPGENFLLWVNHFNMAMIEYAIKLFKKGVFDIIHSHDWITAFAGRVLKHGAHIPLIATIHATESGRNQGIHNETQFYISSIEWWLTYEAWRVICCSKYMMEELKFLFNLPSDKIRVIPNGIHPESLNNLDLTFNRRDYASDNEHIVFFIGRHVEEKGIQTLIRAIPRVTASYPNVKFVIAGTGPRYEYLKDLVCQLGINNNVIFTGFIEDKKRNSFFKNSEIAVFPSIYEPFGIVALEAMACKVPVIVGDTGGFREIVRHNLDGIRVSPGNEEDLANAILSLLSDPLKAEQIKNKGYRRAIEDFSWDRVAENTIYVYNEVLSEYKNSSWKDEKTAGNPVY